MGTINGGTPIAGWFISWKTMENNGKQWKTMENNGKQWKTRLEWMETTNQRVPDVPACSSNEKNMKRIWKEYGKNMERIHKNTFQTLHFS